MSDISPKPEEALVVGQKGYSLWKKVLGRDSWARGIMMWAVNAGVGHKVAAQLDPIDELRLLKARGLITDEVMNARILDVKIRTGQELTEEEMELLKKITAEEMAAEETRKRAAEALRLANGDDVDGGLRGVEAAESGRPESDPAPADQGANDDRDQ